MNSRRHLGCIADFCGPVDRTLVVIPCGVRKIWDRNPAAGKIPAKDAYTSQLFRAQRTYAEAFGTDWVILSARYGLTHPDQLIENYDCKFAPADLEPKNWWRLEGLARQARSLPPYDLVILLGSKLYRSILRRVFVGIVPNRQIVEPFANHDLPRTIAALHSAIAVRNGLTQRVYRLQRELRKLPLVPANPGQRRRRTILTAQLLRAAREDRCLGKITLIAGKR